MTKAEICAFALTLSLLVSLAACGGVSQKVEPAMSAPAQTSTEPAQVSAAPDAPAALSAPEETVIRVSTADAFLNAIAPGAVIELAPGTYNLTEYLDGVSDDISDYVERGFCSDGWQAEVNRVDGLTIRGAESDSVVVVVEPRHADVLYFNACSDITIENVTFGHTIEPGNCDGAVLDFSSCQNVTLNALDLYGCGTYGVAAEHTTGITLSDSIIRDCSYGIISLNVCGDVTAKSCTFKDNNGYDLLSINNSFVHFDGCAFTGNEGDEFLHASAWYGDDSGARFDGCTFDRWESERLSEELKGHGNYMIGSDCQFKVEIGRRIVRATNVEQLLENIAPDTEILLAPGKYNLSDGLTELREQKGDFFAESLAFVQINEEYDGPELIVTGVSGLTIASESGCANDTQIVTDPRHADVIRFENCSGTGIMNLTMGHTEGGDCSGDVLYFADCGGTVLYGLDLYGCGVYGIGTNACGRLSCFDSTIRDCKYGALELYSALERQMFLNCVMTGSGSGGYFYADGEPKEKFYFYRCFFGNRESNSFAFDDAITAEACSWSQITDYPDSLMAYNLYEPVALDTTHVKTVPFDTQVLASVRYYLCYEVIDRQLGNVTLEPAASKKLLTFEKNGTGFLLDNNGVQHPYRFVMGSNYSCVLSFDDGREGMLSLCTDQGEILPGSEAGHIWLQLYLGDEVLWFY